MGDINISVEDLDGGGLDVDIEIEVDAPGADEEVTIPVEPEYIPGRDGVTFEPLTVKTGRVVTLSFTNNGNRPNPPPVEIMDGQDGTDAMTTLIGTAAAPLRIAAIVDDGEYILKGEIEDLPDSVTPRVGDGVDLSVRRAAGEIVYRLTYGSMVVFAKEAEDEL
jgi:hypothetical protein